MATEDTILFKIGDNIARHRKNNGLTQEELAEKVGISRSGLWNYENDKRAVDHDTLLKIAYALDSSIFDLLGLQEHERVELLSTKDLLDPFTFEKINELRNFINIFWGEAEIETSLVIQNILIHWFAQQDAYVQFYNNNPMMEATYKGTANGWSTGFELYDELNKKYWAQYKEQKRREDLDDIVKLIKEENFDSPSQYFVKLVNEYVKNYGKEGLSNILLDFVDYQKEGE